MPFGRLGGGYDRTLTNTTITIQQVYRQIYQTRTPVTEWDRSTIS
jgi:hypothetical protein